MIKINLALKKQSGLAGSRGGFGDSFKSLNLESIRVLPIRQVAVPLMIGLVASYLLDYQQEEQMKEITLTAERSAVEVNRIQVELAKLKGTDAIKKEVEADEREIRAKLETGQKLIGSRATSARILMGVSAGIPKEVWLQSFKFDSKEIRMKGSSFDFTMISDFMKTLNENGLFAEVELATSHQEKDTKAGEVTVFELRTQRKVN